MNNKFIKIINIIKAIIINIILGIIYMNLQNPIAKIFFTPFVLCAILMFFMSIATKNSKLEVLYSKFYEIIFLVYWFGFLIFFDFLSFKQNELSVIYFSLIFWLAGFYIVYKDFFKKK